MSHDYSKDLRTNCAWMWECSLRDTGLAWDVHYNGWIRKNLLLLSKSLTSWIWRY